MAMIVEQAGGSASWGRGRVLDCVPGELHQRVPLILGCRSEVERIERYHLEHDQGLDRIYSSPLFKERSLVHPERMDARGRIMSAKHPIIAVTGSSGAGTTSVTRTFNWIFRRERINAVLVEGDSFHRYDRARDEAEDGGSGRARRSALQPLRAGRTICSRSSRSCSAATARAAAARSAATCTTRRKRQPYRQEPGTFTDWRGDFRGHRPAVLRGPARRRRSPRR